MIKFIEQMKKMKKIFSAMIKILAGTMVTVSVFSNTCVIASELKGNLSDDDIEKHVKEEVTEEEKIQWDIIEEIDFEMEDTVEENISNDVGDSENLGNPDDKTSEADEQTNTESTKEKTEDLENEEESEQESNQICEEVTKEETNENLELERQEEEISNLESETEEIILEEDMEIEDFVKCEGVCGDKVAYCFLIESGKLVITGSGQVYDYADAEQLPWGNYFDDIKSVELEEGVTVKLWMINKNAAQRVGKYEKS